MSANAPDTDRVSFQRAVRIAIIVALLIGVDLLGFVGLLVAVPLAAVVQVFLRDGLAAHPGSLIHAGSAPGGAGADGRALSLGA